MPDCIGRRSGRANNLWCGSRSSGCRGWLTCHSCHGSSSICRSLGSLLLLFLLRLLISSVSFLVKAQRERGLTSCHPQSGTKLSKNPISSNNLGYSHNPGETAKYVIAKRINRKITITKNNPIKPSIPILKYQTPSLIFIGQSGNITIANTIASAAAAYNFCLIWAPS